MLEMYELMILVISWVITICIVGAIIVITSVKVYEWTEYRDEEGYSIIWGRYGKVLEPTNEDILDLRKKFEFLKELTENLSQSVPLMKEISTNLQTQMDDLSQRGELMKQVSDNLQAQINNLQAQVDELADRKGKRRPSSDFSILKAEINKVINDNNEQDNGTNPPTN